MTTDEQIHAAQSELNHLYDDFSAKYDLINSRANALAFQDDSSYYLLCTLEELDEEKQLKSKADIFTKRTIKPHEVVTSVDTPSEALALSISEKAHVDLAYMSELTGMEESELISGLQGVIFRDPVKNEWQTADEYLSGNVRQKLREAEAAAETDSAFLPNVEALRSSQPKDLDASEIEVRLGATWIDRKYIQEFMEETFEPPYYLRRNIQVLYSPFTAEWSISGKSTPSYGDVNAYMTYGTDRANAYRILEDTLNLRDVRIYDTKTDPDGKEKRVLNSKETTLAQQKQQAIKDAFAEWIWKDPNRRQELVTRYDELFNSNRPREYDGRHISFSGMNPEIHLREHQLNAVVHILYIKIAFLEDDNTVGMFHEKLGLMYDCDGNVIAFSGSMNESANAFTTNYEAIDVFTSWTQDADRVYTVEMLCSKPRLKLNRACILSSVHLLTKQLIPRESCDKHFGHPPAARLGSVPWRYPPPVRSYTWHTSKNFQKALT